MFIRALCFSAIALAVATPPAFADGYPANQSTSNAAMQQRHQGGTRLPKELRMMWRQEEHGHLKAMAKEQRHGWLKAKWNSMSDSQKQVKLAELQKKWNALPAGVRDNLLEKKRQKHEAHRAKSEQRGTDRGATPSSIQ